MQDANNDMDLEEDDDEEQLLPHRVLMAKEMVKDSF